MNENTPLTEVAAHLPAEAAGLLLECDSSIQTTVLTQVRNMVVYWEQRGHVLDPMTYGDILSTVVATLVALDTGILALGREVVGLKTRLRGAELMIEALMMSREANEP